MQLIEETNCRESYKELPVPDSLWYRGFRSV